MVEGKSHLLAFIGSDNCKCEYVNKLVKDWNSQLCNLSNLEESQSQAIYLTFVSSFNNKLSYFIRTIPSISNLLPPIEDTLGNRFIPTITGARICNEKEGQLLSLPTRYEGLAISIFQEQAEVG